MIGEKTRSRDQNQRAHDKGNPNPCRGCNGMHSALSGAITWKALTKSLLLHLPSTRSGFCHKHLRPECKLVSPVSARCHRGSRPTLHCSARRMSSIDMDQSRWCS